MNIKDLLRQSVNEKNPGSQFQEWSEAANGLQQKFSEAKSQIHAALCDNIDTRTTLDLIRDLVGQSNIYIRDNSPNGTLNLLLLKRIATYITDILHIYGVISGARGGIGFPIESSSGSGDVSDFKKKFTVNVD